MKKIILAVILFSGFFSFSQDPKEEVKEVIKTFFEGFHTADTLLLKQTMADHVIFQTASKNKVNKDVLKQDDVSNFIKVIGSGRPVKDNWEERIKSYHIQVDGNMANAWTEYEFWLDGTFSHCGVNSFQLFHDNGTWKIIYLIDTRRKSNCAAYSE